MMVFKVFRKHLQDYMINSYLRDEVDNVPQIVEKSIPRLLQLIEDLN